MIPNYRCYFQQLSPAVETSMLDQRQLTIHE